MAQQVINIGSLPNDGTGDPLRVAYNKINENFTELYTGGGGGGFNGGTISNPLTITADVAASQGSLKLTGDLSDIEITNGLLQVGNDLNFSDTDIIASLTHTVDSYVQVVLQNQSNGFSASSDFIVANDTPSVAVYGDFGINSSNFTAAGDPFGVPDGTYLYAAGGQLAVGTKDNFDLKLATANTDRITVGWNGDITLSAQSQVIINNTTGSTSHDSGALVVAGGVGVGGNIVGDNALYVGRGAESTGFVNPTIVAKQTGIEYIQAALVNSSSTGSADWVAYASNGTAEHGWSDFGFTGAAFNDPNYTITHEGEGYFFVAGVDDGVSHGTLVLCTHDTGTENDIVFGTGGFLSANERIRLRNNDLQFHIEMTTASTSVTTGALRVDGGVGVAGNVYADALYDSGNRVLTTANIINYVGDYKSSAQTADHGQWLLLNESSNRLVSRTTYASLFALLGTTYGGGDGTTFGLPSRIQVNSMNFISSISA